MALKSNDEINQKIALSSLELSRDKSAVNFNVDFSK